MRSIPAHKLSFIFEIENILWSYFNFSTSYGRSTDLKSLVGLLLVSLNGSEKKKFTKIFTYRRVGVPHAQTVSTSFMSKLVNEKNKISRLRPKWTTKPAAFSVFSPTGLPSLVSVLRLFTPFILRRAQGIFPTLFLNNFRLIST